MPPCVLPSRQSGRRTPSQAADESWIYPMDRVIEPLPVAPSRVFGPDTANEEICPIAFVWSAVRELAFLLNQASRSRNSVASC